MAEDNALVDDRLATHNEREKTGIDDRAIVSVAVKAIKELKLKVDDLQANASASSGTGTDGLFSWILSKFSAIGIMFGQDKIGAKIFAPESRTEARCALTATNCKTCWIKAA